MEHIDMVEKLREKANISYEEAKAALEKTDWDLLDAMVLLEKDGKVKDEGEPSSTSNTSYSTKREKKAEQTYESYDIPKDTVGVGDLVNRFFRFMGKLMHKGNQNYLNVYKNGNHVFSIPVTVFAILLIFTCGTTLFLMILGLFFSFEYSITGPDLEREDINNVIHKASEVADNIKDEFKDAATAKKQEKEARQEAQPDDSE